MVLYESCFENEASFCPSVISILNFTLFSREFEFEHLIILSSIMNSKLCSACSKRSVYRESLCGNELRRERSGFLCARGQPHRAQPLQVPLRTRVSLEFCTLSMHRARLLGGSRAGQGALRAEWPFRMRPYFIIH